MSLYVDWILHKDATHTPFCHTRVFGRSATFFRYIYWEQIFKIELLSTFAVEFQFIGQKGSTRKILCLSGNENIHENVFSQTLVALVAERKVFVGFCRKGFEN